MATPKKKKTSEEQLAAVETEVLSAEQSAPQEETPLGGAPPSEVELPQTESDNEIQSAGSEDNADSKNESGEIPAITDAPPSQTVRTRKRIILPDNDMNVLTIDNKLGVQTEADKARDAMLDLIESLRTRRYLTDTLEGVEKSTTGGEPRAVLYHGDFKVIIPASLVVKLPNDLRDQDPFEVYHYLLSKRLGAEIDYVVKGIDPDTGIAVGDRMAAMATKRRHYYVNTTRDGTYRTYEGLVCEARVMSVIRDGIFVELFGIDIYIPLRELSYIRIVDAVGYYMPGDRILVKIMRLYRDDPEDIHVVASAKRVAVNPQDKAIEKIVIENNYAGTVSMLDSNGIFVQLDIGIECKCKFPPRARPPKGARVVVKISGVDPETRRVWGIISYVSIPR